MVVVYVVFVVVKQLMPAFCLFGFAACAEAISKQAGRMELYTEKVLAALAVSYLIIVSGFAWHPFGEFLERTDAQLLKLSRQ